MTVETIRVGRWFQGPTGSGQGGWTAHRLAAALPVPVTVAIRAPIPLDRELRVVGADGRWELIDEHGVTIMGADEWQPRFADTTPVSVSDARRARDRFGDLVTEHPVPFCFSCGVQHDSMRVHAGPLGDGRFASDWTLPEWAVDGGGRVDTGALWAALDCCAAWWVGYSGEQRTAFTVQYAVDESVPIDPGATYALVAWPGDDDHGWDGRKRRAASAAFDTAGRCVARSVSLWVAAGADDA